MAILRILVPDATVNYVKNPSARYDTTGWNAFSSTLTRVLTQARFGIASIQVVTNGTALYEGLYYRVNALAGISDPVTVSIYAKGAGLVRLRLIDNPVGMEWASQPVSLRTDRWTRLEVTGRSTGSNDMRLYVETVSIKAVTFYVDGAQMERKPYATTYADGDQAGCRWNIVAHNSHSIREAYSRAGGRWVELSGEERADENLYMTVVGGLGLPPITNNTQSYADAPGGYYQNTKVLARTLTLTFHAKHTDKEIKCSPQSLAYLHALRQMLIDLIKPDRTRGGEEFTLQYQDGDYPVYLKVRYDGGLEGDWDVRNSWVNSFPLRLLAVSPYWYEDEQNVSTLDFQEWPDANSAIARVDGQWNNMNYGVNDDINNLAIGSRGEVIAVGNFTRANSDVSAIDPLIPANRIAWWDGEKWNLYDTGGGANNFILNLAVGPNGYIYVCGYFTSIGGVAANRVAYWDGSTWNAMGAGVGSASPFDYVRAIAVAPNGDVYVGGYFQVAGGGTAYYIARWDGGSWHPVGAGAGLNSIVTTLACAPDGSAVYAGGEFTAENLGAANGLVRVAKYNVSGGTWEALGDGFDQVVYKLKISPSGVLYAAGLFDLSGSITVNHIAYWNGSTWSPLGTGIDAVWPDGLWDMDATVDGDVIVAGKFTGAGDVEANGTAVWNGSVWTNLDIVSTDYLFSVIYDKDKNIYIGSRSLPNLHVGGVTLVTNTGTAETNPVVYALGPATLKYLENYTTKKRVYFDLTLLSGEEVFIDFGRGTVTSTVRGDLSYTVKPGSDMRAFTLLPGENKIIAFMIDDVNAKLQMSYTPRHWSADSTARGEGL